ncbi:hypothetical protein [Microvirga thermotolerans]|uniref:Uncharacterized protein n=1 Tax=Microvirga thermotolerans TaxID=2651334 RepID=A0A5P9JQW5_9HYPH|nr:hypothetical protein [Microvirga thermotolerans]QFU15152.1 hypothetical protein GDR74_02385 [Microvirga thermotolerans]
MKNCTSKLVFYNRTLDDITDLMCRRRLRCCEPVIIYGFRFSTMSDLAVARLGVEGSIISDGMAFMVLPSQQADVESAIRRMGMEARVQRFEIAGVWFWGIEDRAVFDEEFGPAV